jgi:hypothetical protein
MKGWISLAAGDDDPSGSKHREPHRHRTFDWHDEDNQRQHLQRKPYRWPSIAPPFTSPWRIAVQNKKSRTFERWTGGVDSKQQIASFEAWTVIR